MALDFETRHYEMAHGKAPRGRGMWAFELRNGRTVVAPMFWHNGTYGEAKRAARAHFSAPALASLGREVVVLS